MVDGRSAADPNRIHHGGMPARGTGQASGVVVNWSAIRSLFHDPGTKTPNGSRLPAGEPTRSPSFAGCETFSSQTVVWSCLLGGRSSPTPVSGCCDHQATGASRRCTHQHPNHGRLLSGSSVRQRLVLAGASSSAGQENDGAEDRSKPLRKGDGGWRWSGRTYVHGLSRKTSRNNAAKGGS